MSWQKEFLRMCREVDDERAFIYFLFLEGKIVYVGQTINLPVRISTHVTDGNIQFDDFETLECKKSELNKLERQFITLYLPKHNTCQHTQKVKRQKMLHLLPEYQRVLLLCQYYELQNALRFITPKSQNRADIIRKYETVIPLSTAK